jgi:hypothetical protein
MPRSGRSLGLLDPRAALLAATLGISVAAIGLSPAAAITFTVNNTVYKASTFSGTYNASASNFSSALMPWWGSQALAQAFTKAIYGPAGALVNPFVSLYPSTQGLPNQIFFPPATLRQGAPLLAWQFDSVALTWNTVYAAAYPINITLSLAIGGRESDLDYSLEWITAEAVPVPVPAPLPLIGGAAAFAWSRRLRRRAARF